MGSVLVFSKIGPTVSGSITEIRFNLHTVTITNGRPFELQIYQVGAFSPEYPGARGWLQKISPLILSSRSMVPHNGDNFFGEGVGTVDFRITIEERLQRFVPALGRVDLSACSITDETTKWVLWRLRSLGSLKAVSLRCNFIGRNGADDIAQCLVGLEELDIAYNRLGPAGADSIAKYLTSLKSLDISGNPIKNSGAIAIAEKLKSLSTLKIASTSLWGVDLFRILPKIIRLQSLDVSKNSIGNLGAHAIAKHLKFLTSLHIEFNFIEDAGIIAIAQNLPSLRSLNISSNSIGDDGLIAIGEHLTTLNSLKVSRNELKDANKVVVLLRNLAPRNLQEIDVSGNRLYWPGITSISESILRVTNPMELLSRLEEIRDASNRTQIFMGRLVMSGPTEHGKTHLARWLVAETGEEKSCLRQRLDRGNNGQGTWGADLLKVTLRREDHKQPALKDVQLRIVDCGGHPQQLQSNHNLYHCNWSRTVFVLCARSDQDFVKSSAEYHLGLLADMKILTINHRRSMPVNVAGLRAELELPGLINDPERVPVHVVMVRTHSDISGQANSLLTFPSDEDLEANHPLIAAVRVEEWDAMTGQMLANVRLAIGTQLAKLPELSSVLATYVLKIGEAIEKEFAPDEGFDRPPLRKSMSYAEFQILCDELEVPDVEHRHRYILRTLDDLGYLTAPGCHHEDPAGQSRILNPKFVQHFLFQHLLNRKPRPADGIITATEYAAIVADLSDIDRSAFESLMRSCLVAFKIEARRGDRLLGWLIPDLLVPNSDWPAWTSVLCTAHLKAPGFLNESEYFEFLRDEKAWIEQSHDGGFKVHRDGCILAKGDTHARVRFSACKRTIDIEVVGGLQREAERWCLTLLQRFERSTGVQGEVRSFVGRQLVCPEDELRQESRTNQPFIIAGNDPLLTEPIANATHHAKLADPPDLIPEPTCTPKEAAQLVELEGFTPTDSDALLRKLKDLGLLPKVRVRNVPIRVVHEYLGACTQKSQWTCLECSMTNSRLDGSCSSCGTERSDG